MGDLVELNAGYITCHDQIENVKKGQIKKIYISVVGIRIVVCGKMYGKIVRL